MRGKYLLDTNMRRLVCFVVVKQKVLGVIPMEGLCFRLQIVKGFV